MASNTGKRRRSKLSLPSGPRRRSMEVEIMPPPPPRRRPRTHDGARDQEGTGSAGTRSADDSASPESAPGNTDDDDYIYPDTDGGGEDMHAAVGQPAGPIRGRAAEEAARQEELARVLAKSMTDARSNENAPSGGAAEPSTHQGSSAGGAADGGDAPARGGLVNGGSTCWLNTLIQVASSPRTTLGRTLIELSRCEWDGAMKERLSALWQMVDATGKVTSAEPGTPSIHAGFVGANGILNPAGFKAWEQAQCSSCAWVHSVANGSLEPHLMLHLPGESSDPATSLQDLLDAWTTPREMSDSVCANCSQLTSSQQLTFISKAPATLVLIINRTRWIDGTGGHGGKNDRAVQFDREASLLLRSASGTTQTQRYDVRGIGVHIGPSLNAGHYKAFVAGRNDTWVCADDADTTEVSWRDVRNVNPTIMVLERQQDGGRAAATHGTDVPSFWSAAVAAARGQASGSGGQAPGGVSGDGSSETDDDGSSSGETDGDGSSSGSGSGSGGSRSRSSSRSRSRSRSSSGGSGGGSSGGSGSSDSSRRRGSSSSSGSSSSGGGGSGGSNSGGTGSSDSSRRRGSSSSSGSSSGGGGGGGGALSPAQADAMKSLERNAAWFLRIEGREVTLAEKQEARRLLENPRELHGLRNEALKNPQVYRGTRSAEDLDRHQLRNLAGAAILPKNGLHAVYDNFEGDLGRMREEFDNAADGGLALFMDFLQSKGGEGRVHEDHPAFADPASWNKPVLCMQGMCRQGLKLPFFHRAQTTVTGKVAKACDAVSPFVGGPVAKMNRTLASCVKIVTDSDGSSVPHCSAVGLLRRELVGTAMVVEVAWMRALLHNFPNSRGVGLFRGGDITTAGRGRNQVQELAAVGGRTAFVYHGNHQCRALGAEDALDGSVRGPLELYRACTGGPPVTEKDVAYGTVDLVGAVLDLQVEAQGGATDNDERRYAELIEATVQGHAQARAKALEVAREIRGKATRSRDDCASGGKIGGEASIRNRKKDPEKYKNDCSAGGRIGGKGTQGHKISSSGGSRGARTGREPINDSSVMVSIGFFRRAHKITVGEKIVDVKISKRKSEFFRFRDVRGTDSNKWIIGLRRFDSNGSDKTLSYPADDEGNMVTGEEWDADPEKGLYHDHLVTYAWKYLQKRERATAPAQS